MDIFVKGLPTKEMRRFVHQSKADSLDAAVNLATSFQGFDVQVDIDRVNKKPKNGASTHTVSGNKKANPAARKKSVASSQASARFPPLTETLAKINERLEKLEKKPDPPEEERRKPKSDWKPDWEPICFNCGGKGPMANGCPLKDAALQRDERPAKDQR